ncbi:DUF3566 domain-containing protein [Geodermatophilus marinus]|uniref:DUF3566 domain-containing protein n=1 Tax=Geodermatophilus sp. LHW52908 TaxID=2303986 RepID=UPI000E3C016B|nr:DUF3566 domain-containing protein [Geodermatophilus sp. LHW52908]RFU21032.1 DUF3566 domain-containing protein [Geodermatophilus sp. LHW52908]
MSDRTQGSVRTGSRAGETAPVTGGPPGAGKGATGSVAPTDGAPAATSSSPATGTQRATPATGAQRAAEPAVADGTAPVGPPAGSVPLAKGASAAGTATPAAAGPPSAGAPAGAPATGTAEATAPAARPAGRGRPARGPRRARLQLRHIDTWSALKISLVLSIALFFIWMVAVGILYGVLSGLGVFDTLNDLFGQLGTASGAGGDGEVITPGIVFGGAAVVGAINIVLMTALCTVAAFIYNMCSDLVGGLEVTLSERD